MDTARTVTEIRQKIETLRQPGPRVGLVPTMGFLHDGHAALIRESAAACDVTGEHLRQPDAVRAERGSQHLSARSWPGRAGSVGRRVPTFLRPDGRRDLSRGVPDPYRAETLCRAPSAGRPPALVATAT